MSNLVQKAIENLDKAYAPYSKFHVSCVLITDEDEVYTGVNVENASYGLTICAERSAIAAMISNSKTRQSIKEIIVLSKAGIRTPPCGACRQVISEFASDKCQVILPYGKNYDKLFTVSMENLMPHKFDLEFQ